MFLESIKDGLLVFTFWETYVAILIYLVIAWGPLLFFGNFGGFLVIPFQVIGSIVFIFMLSPIILGIDDTAFWSFPWLVLTNEPITFLKITGMLFLTYFVLAFIPFFGQLDSVANAVLGWFCLSYVLKILFLGTELPLYPIPGFMYSMGFIMVVGLSHVIGIGIVTGIASIVSGEDIETEGIMMAIMFPIMSVCSFISVFIYGAWLGNQLPLEFKMTANMMLHMLQLGQ